ncbi:hypothetical protein GCM10027046_15860 [Uliginosibacterium flavum]|uniref:DUF4395 family protein n=1 Tax=Uliginosibacterium flavum TaxID=1396831 RepID=A0ABV2TN37_9RHOO
MLRFDIPPVWSNAARLDGLATFVICAAALLGFPYLVPLLIVQGLVRGFFGHYRCPSHRLYTVLLQKFGAAGKKENAGAKMFANKLLLIASSVATALYLTGSSMWIVPVSALLAFSFLEAVVSFCAACWAYSLWYQLRGQN